MKAKMKKNNLIMKTMMKNQEAHFNAIKNMLKIADDI